MLLCLLVNRLSQAMASMPHAPQPSSALLPVSIQRAGQHMQVGTTVDGRALPSRVRTIIIATMLTSAVQSRCYIFRAPRCASSHSGREEGLTKLILELSAPALSSRIRACRCFRSVLPLVRHSEPRGGTCFFGRHWRVQGPVKYASSITQLSLGT